MTPYVAVTEHTSNHLLSLIDQRREKLSLAVISGASPDELAVQVHALAMLVGGVGAAQSIETELGHITDAEELLIVAESLLRKGQISAHSEDDTAVQSTGNAAGRSKVARAYIRAVESGMALEEIRSAAGVVFVGAAA